MLRRFFQRRHLDPLAEGDLPPLARDRLARIWQGGANDGWHPEDVLDGIEAAHGPLECAEPKAMGELLSLALWEAAAAWEVSARLAVDLSEVESRLAVTAQAHDEARHVMLLREVLERMQLPVSSPPPAALKALQQVHRAREPGRALVGLHLMLEPIALTFYRMVQSKDISPGLRAFFQHLEEDEVRHVSVGLGVLPPRIRRMSRVRKADLAAWQLRLFLLEMRGLKQLERPLRELGFKPMDVLRLGHSKQLFVVDLLTRDLGDPVVAARLFNRAVELQRSMDWEDDSTFARTLTGALKRALNPEEAPAHTGPLPW
ncbi:MAG: ferritin-like domain-containing protein [Myxococcota bacterium]|nr:ferritin-like domain-containing protein [Myxococcota bacterium]